MATSCRTAFAVSHASNSCARLQHRLVLRSGWPLGALRCPNSHVHWPCTASNAAARKAAVLPAAVPGVAAVSAGASLPSDFDRSVYLDASADLPHYVGPITVANIPGKGRGLVATQPLSPGQLLLVVPPLVLVEGELGEIPDHDDLIEVLSVSGALFSPWQAHWLKSLTTTTAGHDTAYSSSSSSSSSQQQQQQQPPVVPAFLPPPGQAAWQGVGSGPGAAAGGGGGSVDDRVPFEALEMDEEQLWAAVVLNCYGEGFPDLPASLCASSPLNSQLGLWGPFSLLNHACCPNAVNYTLRDCMVVRCCAPVAAGGEVVINYLGRSALTPLSQRQLELEACYGFKCDCNRCRAEAAWTDVSTPSGMPLSAFLDQLHARTGQEFEPRRAQIAAHMTPGTAGDPQGSQDETAVGQQQRDELQQLLQQMQQQWEQLLSAARERAAAAGAAAALDAASSAAGRQAPLTEQQLSRPRPPPPPAAAAVSPEGSWVLASAFDLLGLLHDASEVLGCHDQAVLEAIVRVCEEVCPGSDLHVFQALRWTSIAQQQEQQQQEEEQEQEGKEDAGFRSRADDAMQGLVRALQVRYGPQVGLDEELLSRMVAASSEAANMVWL